ncbi:MAG: hypothetical protein ACAH95_16020 [Fimbriimonas sp.]
MADQAAGAPIVVVHGWPAILILFIAVLGCDLLHFKRIYKDATSEPYK